MRSRLRSAGVPVYAKKSDNKPALIMWFFDSRSFVRGNSKPYPTGTDQHWVDEKEVPTYIRQQSQAMKETVSCLRAILEG